MASTTEALDNPIWSALHSGHARLAVGDATAVWYPEDVGPFGAVAADGAAPSADAMSRLRERSEALHFIGCLPALPADIVSASDAVLQMTCARPASGPRVEPVAVRPLTVADVPAMLDLMARVYPGYFRRRTHLLGSYLGVFEAGALVAMGGERFRLDAHCELSGIVTDPSAAGRGYARAIVRRLVESLFDRGLSPFLHVAPANARAIDVYRALGFTARAELPLLTIHPVDCRPADTRHA